MNFKSFWFIAKKSFILLYLMYKWCMYPLFIVGDGPSRSDVRQIYTVQKAGKFLYYWSSHKLLNNIVFYIILKMSENDAFVKNITINLEIFVQG